MVHKRYTWNSKAVTEFENDVKMYGTQASALSCDTNHLFENDVKMYGTQAVKYNTMLDDGFENDVKMYGTQAG